jgi:hypothetical protein
VAARTGDIIEELPDLDVSRVKQTIGRYEVASGASLPVVDAPTEWERATKPGASFLVLVEDNPVNRVHGIPLWGAMPIRRRRSAADQVQLDLITGEGYLGSRYVGDESFAGVGQNAIFQALVESYIVEGAGGRPGIPIRVQVLDDGDGKERDREYFDQDDKTIYSVFQDLMGVSDGPEWTIGWEWQTSPERLTMVLYVGTRIGSSPVAGLQPAALFGMPGNVSAFDLTEDFGAGRGSNDVIATSSGEGDLRPQSEPARFDDDPDRPTFEYRFSPSTSIVNVETLNEHAAKALNGMKSGVTTLELTAAVEDAPRLGVAWGLGDDVAFDLKAPSLPSGKSGTARVAGWERTLGGVEYVKPILALASGGSDG